MAFPDSDLQVKVYAYLGADPNSSPSGWPSPVDLTGRLLDREISASLGRRQGQGTAAAGQCSFWLDNHDGALTPGVPTSPDRKSTRLNSSHVKISYAVFCLK